MLLMIGVWGIARHSSSMDGVIDGSIVLMGGIASDRSSSV